MLTSRASASSHRSIWTASRRCERPSGSPSLRRAGPLPGLLERLGPAIAKTYNTAGPGYLAYIPGGGVYASALADFIATATNRYVGVTAAAPALAQIEETSVAWLCTLMGLPAGSRGILTSGGSLSNFSAIVTARHERLGEYFQDGVDLPLRGDAPLRRQGRAPGRLSASEPAHLADRQASAARAGGAGGGHPGRPHAGPPAVPRRRERRHHEHRRRGPFARDRARSPGEHGLWVHADAAYGGFFRLAPGGEALLRGIEDCDSITLDPHKGLFLPYGLGALLVRDGGALARAHRAAPATCRT